LERQRILIAGVSTRAAAESAAKAGFEVTAIDAFGDLDQHPSVRSQALRETGDGFTAHAAARAASEIACDAVAYLSPFENHPRAVESLMAGPVTLLGAGRSLWGNPPDVLRRVRDPFLVAAVLRRRGFTTPITRVDVTAEAKAWLLKPFRSGGGQAIRLWTSGTQVPESHYVQQRIEGVPASIVFVAANGRAVPLGVSRQLIGETAFGADSYRYCGNVLAQAGDAILTDAVVTQANDLAGHASGEFGLVGLNGIDVIVRDGTPYPIEINPRWSSSMELVERAYGVSVFGAHAAACVDGVLPAFDLMRARQSRVVTGKAIVFAREDVMTGDTRSWLSDGTIRDVPKPGERIAAGHPICTVFAEDADAAQCLAQLRDRAQAILVACPTRCS
jgi:predicted ATP-grasp superfamily ATP-dependent carboligase